MDLCGVLLQNLLIFKTVSDGEGVTNLAADPRRAAMLLRSNMEYDGHPTLEKRVAAQAADHGLVGAVDLHFMLLHEAKVGE